MNQKVTGGSLRGFEAEAYREVLLGNLQSKSVRDALYMIYGRADL